MNVPPQSSPVGLDSSPKGTPLGAAAKFPSTAEAVPLGKVAANAVSRRKGCSPRKETPPVISLCSMPAPSEMGPLAWRQSSPLKHKVPGRAKGSPLGELANVVSLRG